MQTISLVMEYVEKSINEPETPENTPILYINPEQDTIFDVEECITVTLNDDNDNSSDIHPVVQSQEEPEPKEKNFEWTYSSTRQLIDLRTDYDNQFLSASQGKKIKVWERLAKVLSERCCKEISGKRCCEKFKTLKRNYIRVRDCQNRSGSRQHKWKYFEAMDRLLGTKDNTIPKEYIYESDVNLSDASFDQLEEGTSVTSSNIYSVTSTSFGSGSTVSKTTNTRDNLPTNKRDTSQKLTKKAANTNQFRKALQKITDMIGIMEQRLQESAETDKKMNDAMNKYLEIQERLVEIQKEKLVFKTQQLEYLRNREVVNN